MAGSKKSSQLAQQIEFYMSNANLRRDAFFQEQIKNTGAFVPVSVFLQCNRVKKITSDPKQVVKAIEEHSKHSLVLNETKDAIARKDHETFDLESILHTAPEKVLVANIPTKLAANKLNSSEWFGTNAFVKLYQDLAPPDVVKSLAMVEFDSQEALDVFLERKDVVALPMLGPDFCSAVCGSNLFVMKESQFDAFINKGKELYQFDPNATLRFMHTQFRLQKAIVPLEDITSLVEPVAKPIYVYRVAKSTIYAEFSCVEDRDKVFEAFVTNKSITKENFRADKIEAPIAVLLRAYEEQHKKKPESVEKSSRKASDLPKRASKKAKTEE